MSGRLELAGVALAMFPLTISLLEHYEEGFQAIETWRFYRLQFTTLVSELNREKVLFQQHIEGLIQSISHSEHDVKKMASDLHCIEWKSPDLAARLKLKVSGENELQIYESAIESIHENLKRLGHRIDRCSSNTSE